MGCFLPLLLILLLVLEMKSLILPAIWHALSGPLKKSAFAFLFLNCVTLTIIASSKLGSEERGCQLEEGEKQGAMKVIKNRDEEGKDVIDTTRRLSLYFDTPFENGNKNRQNDVESAHMKPALYGHGFYKSKREVFLGSSWSVNASFENRTRHEPTRLIQVKASVKDKKPIRSRGRLESRKNEILGLHSSTPMNSELLKKQITRGGSDSSNSADRKSIHDHDEKSLLTEERRNSTLAEQCSIRRCSGYAKVVADLEPQQAEDPATAAAETAHPSMEEVWAAILSAKKYNDRMASCVQMRKRSRERSFKAIIQPHPAAPTNTATLVAPLTPAAASASINTPRSASILIYTAAKNRPPAASAQNHAVAGNGSTELEELKHRADEFIERFNRQMRLQREESLKAQRQMKRDRRRDCNYDVQYSRMPPSPVSEIEFVTCTA